MKNYLLKPLIEKFKYQDMTAFPLIFDEFKRLINFYAVKLYYEDASSDLTLFLIELLYDIRLSKFEADGGEDIRRYIAVSLKNKYFALLTSKAKNERFNNDFNEECDISDEDFRERVIVIESLNILNYEQKMVVIYRYVYGYSMSEIAELMSISRQTVNKKRNQALEILREAFKKDEDLFL